ncbi:MAG: hypothetical protein KGL39_34420 [Patescibacteria group bacterium]|nr:hypothetical protein [Patescibacteria group bacterium]
MNWAKIDQLREGLTSPRLQVNQQYDDEVKLVAYDFNDRKRFPQQPNSIELIHLTDLQYGSKGFQRERFLHYRDWITANPNRFVFLGGDLIDAATILSVASPYDNTEEPIDQIDGVVELLEPLAAKGRLLGYVGGNHERRTIKTFGDCGRTIARELKVPYSRGVQLIDINFGKHDPFKVSLFHGCGSARTKGAKAQALHRFMQQHGSTLYLIGHLHDAIVLPDWRLERVGGKIKKTKIMGIMSSSFQEYWNSYAETFGMNPSDTMMGRVILYKDGKWEATLR